MSEKEEKKETKEIETKNQNDFWPDRIVKDVEAPPHQPLPTNRLFNQDGLPDMEILQDHLLKEGRLLKKDLLKIIKDAHKLMKKEPNMLEIKAPVTVAGDTHGQYYDLMTLFKVGGDPKETTYLFLGDYVDRGNFSIEIVIHLYCLKIISPKRVLLLRGNHECRHLTEAFTFKHECLYKYDEEVYDAIMDSFDALPLAALLNEQFLCVHGGLSPDIHTINDIQEIDRFCEPASKGPMCDLLWSDPMEEFSPDEDVFFEYNEVRGCSYMYSFNAVCDFLERNQLLSLVRAHEAQDAGYKMHLTNEATGFPSVITLFSAPNYLDAYGNKGAVLRYDGSVMNIRQFNHVKHPYYLPGFMDVFAWSTPFVTEKVAEILLVLLQLPDPPAPKSDDPNVLAEQEKRREAVKNKIRAVSRMRLMMKTLREERETILAIKELAPNGRIPKGLLTQGKDALKAALGDFQRAKKADRPNERRPGDEDDKQRRQKVKKITAETSGGRRRLERTVSGTKQFKVKVEKAN